MTQRLCLRLLGGFEARSAPGKTLRLPTRKVEALLAYLAFRPGKRHSRGTLATLLWGESTDAHARQSLRQSLAALRTALGAARRALVIDGQFVGLDGAQVDVDVAEFESLALTGVLDALERASALYRGDLLAGLDVREPVFEEWLRAERERLHEVALEALAKLLGLHMQDEALEKPIQIALRLLALDPLQEVTHRALMRLYTRQGRRAAALQQYQLCVDVLQRELSLEPEEATRQLYQTILHARQLQPAALEPVPHRRARHRDGVRRGRSVPSLDAPLIGRETEIAQMRQALVDARAGRATVLAVVGEAGVGKTRLVEELSAHASRDGALVLTSRAHRGTGMLPFGPWIELMRASIAAPRDTALEGLSPTCRTELQRLLPDIGNGVSPSPANSGGQVRLFEAVAAFFTHLASRQPLVLVLEDLHWADHTTLRLLSFLSRRIETCPALIIVTARDSPGSAFSSETLDHLRGANRVRILSLAPLSPSEQLTLIRALAVSRATKSPQASAEKRLCEFSRGNPFIIIEMMRGLREGRMIDRAGLAQLPGTVDDIIGEHLSRVSEPGQSLVAIASLIERDFEFLLLQTAAGLGVRDAAAGIEELVRRGVLRGMGDRFAFTHERIADVARNRVPTRQREFCRRQIANAYEKIYRGRLRPYYAELGVYWGETGAWENAAAYFRQAAIDALECSAYAESIALFASARDALGHVQQADHARTGERRNVTVLAAELAWVGALEQPSAGKALPTMVDRGFEIVARNVHRFEGTIEEVTRSGVLAVLGAPIAHEDHAIRAVEAAAAIHAELTSRSSHGAREGSSVSARIGVNTGVVAIGRVGETLQTEYVAEGETKNLAIRLRQMATPAGICAGEATYRLTRNVFDWRPVATTTDRQAAGVSDYQLVARRPVRTRFDIQAQRGLTRFVGRDAELQTLLARWEDAKRGRGQVVSIVGEAGLGKSRLIHEFKRRLANEGALSLEGSCFSYGEAISYLPFLEVVKSYFELEGVTCEEQARQQIAARLDGVSVDRGAVEPYLSQLLAYRLDDGILGRLPTHVIRERTVAALKTLTLAIARREPLALIIEDVHWIDKATEEVVGALVDAMAPVPLLLLLVYRPEYLHAWAARAYHVRIAMARLSDASSAEMVKAILHKPYASKVPVPALPPGQSRQLIEDLLGTSRVAAEVVALVTSRTEGNPLFLEELTRSLLDSGDLVREKGEYVLRRRPEPEELPAIVQGILLARIDRLTNDLKEVLRAAAVIGRVFSYPALLRVLDERSGLDDFLAQLQDLDFLYIVNLSPHREYSFKHVLTQQAVYETLLPALREDLHQRAGRAIEAMCADHLEEVYELLAHHYTKSRDADRAVEYLELAARKAMRMNAMVEAKGFFMEAMRLLDGLPPTEARRRRRIALIGEQWLSFFLLYQIEEYFPYVTRFERLALELNEPGLLAPYYGGMVACLWYFGSFDEAIRTCRRAIELRTAGGEVGDLFSHGFLMWSLFDIGEFEAVRANEADAERAIVKSANSTDLRWYIYTRGALSLACSSAGQFDRGRDIASDVFRRAEEMGDRSTMSFGAWVMAWAHIQKREMTQAIDLATQAAQLAPTPADQSWAYSTLAIAYCRAGHAGQAIEMLSRLVPAYRAGRFMPGEIFTPYLAEAYWRAGDVRMALRTLEEMMALVEPRRMRLLIGIGHRLLGEVRAAENPAQATTHFERSVTLLDEINAQPELALAYVAYGRLHERAGRTAHACDCFSRAHAIFTRLGMVIEPEQVRAELAKSAPVTV